MTKKKKRIDGWLDEQEPTIKPDISKADIFNDPNWADHDPSLQSEKGLIYDVDLFLDRTDDIVLDISTEDVISILKDEDYKDDYVIDTQVCLTCDKALIKERSDKKFCGDACRKKMMRAIKSGGYLNKPKKGWSDKKLGETDEEYYNRLKCILGI